MADLNPVIGQLLALQQRAGITDRQLADKAGYAAQNLSNWRHEGKLPSLPVLADFAMVFRHRLALVPIEPDVLELPLSLNGLRRVVGR